MIAPSCRLRRRCQFYHSPRSLKREIQALGILALATLMLAVLLGIQVFRHTESVLVSEANRQLDRLGNKLAARYDYLRGSAPEATLWGSNKMLRALVQSTLADAEGVEGGFYRHRDKRLLGYAYPTYHGSGTKTDIPPTERPTIQEIIDQAIQQESVAVKQVVSGPDILLFRAQPLFSANQPVGATWLLRRLRGIHRVDRQLYGLGFLGLLVLTSAVVAGAWLITRQFERGVSGMEAGLRKMDRQIDRPLAPVGIRELDRIGSEINCLAQTIQEQHGQRIVLERQLHESERLAALGRLVAGVAHEIRNPLASIKLKLQLARRTSAIPDHFGQVLSVIEEEVARLDRLVVRLLFLAKPSPDSKILTDLTRFLSDRVNHWQPCAASQGITLEFLPVDSALGPIPLDRDRVGQIVDNLLTNSLDALETDKGFIAVEVYPAGAAMIIAVSDNGPGIAPSIVDQLFQPFFTTKAHGTGLGLFLSAEIARAQGGSLRYTDASEGGARFEVHLPC